MSFLRALLFTIWLDLPMQVATPTPTPTIELLLLVRPAFKSLDAVMAAAADADAVRFELAAVLTDRVL